MNTITKYVLFINDDNEGEFDKLQDVYDYIKRYIKGTAETYKKTQIYSGYPLQNHRRLYQWFCIPNKSKLLRIIGRRKTNFE